MSETDAFYAGFDKSVLRVSRIGNMQDAYEQGRREERARIRKVVEDKLERVARRYTGMLSQCVEAQFGNGHRAACEKILAALGED